MYFVLHIINLFLSRPNQLQTKFGSFGFIVLRPVKDGDKWAKIDSTIHNPPLIRHEIRV